MPGRLVTFSGVDCSGKSTQIARLVESLNRDARSVREFWYRPGYSSELDWLRTRIRARSSALPLPHDSRTRAKAFSRRGVSEAWVVIAMVDMLAQYGAKLRWHLARHEFVLCDRYLADARIDLRLRFPELHSAIGRSLGAMEAVLPRPHKAFVLMLPTAEVERRAKFKREPFPDTEDVRRSRIREYEELASQPGFRVLNGTLSPERVHALVVAEMAKP